MKIVKKFWWVPLVLLAAAAGGFVFWANGVPEPMAEAPAAFHSDELVSARFDTVQDWYIFEPTQPAGPVGLIFYPGGKVAPLSYAPFARTLAEQGYLVVIPVMPLNLAVFDVNAARDIITAFPAVDRWVVGGHSLGGAMAASFAGEPDARTAGLLLVGSYPANDLSARTDLAVLSVSGSLDGLSTPDKIEDSRALLPVDTVFVRIEGGNHAQFGWYGDQEGDNPAAISREEQQAQLVEAAMLFMQGLAK